MTPLRARFIAHLELKGYAAKTRRNYLECVVAFTRWLKRSPDTTTREELHRYLLHLKCERKLAIRTLNIHMYALRSFCNFILPGTDLMAPYTRLREPQHQPIVLSRDEIAAMIDSEQNLKYKTVIAVLYSAGLRLSECANLAVGDIDSKRMVIRVREGKGSKDRITILSPRTLEMLRAYWLAYKPRTCLFEGNITGKPIHVRTIGEIVSTAGYKAGQRRRVTPHMLRHSFATHLMENGVALQVIQRLLGHENIQTTTMYTQVSTDMIVNVQSPLDAPPPAPLPPLPKRRGRPRKTVVRRRRKGGRA